jgi:hypothetical protein
MCMLGSVGASSQGGHAKIGSPFRDFRSIRLTSQRHGTRGAKKGRSNAYSAAACSVETSVVSSLDDLPGSGTRFCPPRMGFQNRSKSVSDDTLHEGSGWKYGGLACCSHRRHGSTASPSRAARGDPYHAACFDNRGVHFATVFS